MEERLSNETERGEMEGSDAESFMVGKVGPGGTWAALAAKHGFGRHGEADLGRAEPRLLVKLGTGQRLAEGRKRPAWLAEPRKERADKSALK